MTNVDFTFFKQPKLSLLPFTFRNNPPSRQSSTGPVSSFCTKKHYIDGSITNNFQSKVLSSAPLYFLSSEKDAQSSRTDNNTTDTQGWDIDTLLSTSISSDCGSGYSSDSSTTLTSFCDNYFLTGGSEDRETSSGLDLDSNPTCNNIPIEDQIDLSDNDSNSCNTVIAKDDWDPMQEVCIVPLVDNLTYQPVQTKINAGSSSSIDKNAFFNGDFSSKTCNFSSKKGDFSSKKGDFSSKHKNGFFDGDFSSKKCDFSSKKGDFSSKDENGSFENDSLGCFIKSDSSDSSDSTSPQVDDSEVDSEVANLIARSQVDSKGSACRRRVKDTEGFIRRAACVCVNDDETKVVLISSKHEGGGWLLPGGGLESGEGEAEAAAREAWEEAGIVGIVKRCLGVFQLEDGKSYKKKRTSVFVLEVQEELEEFPEAELGRKRKWFSIDLAIAHLSQNRPHQMAYLHSLIQ